MRIITFNANGIRSAGDKGFWDWFDSQDADILCIQELKAQLADLSEAVTYAASQGHLQRRILSLRAKARIFRERTLEPGCSARNPDRVRRSRV